MPDSPRVEAAARALDRRLPNGLFRGHDAERARWAGSVASLVLAAADEAEPMVPASEHAAVARSIKNQRDENRALIRQLDELRGEDPANVARLKRQLAHVQSHAARIFHNGKEAEERADRAERAARELAEAATELRRVWDSGGALTDRMHGPMGRLAAALAMNQYSSKEGGT